MVYLFSYGFNVLKKKTNVVVGKGKEMDNDSVVSFGSLCCRII